MLKAGGTYIFAGKKLLQKMLREFYVGLKGSSSNSSRLLPLATILKFPHLPHRGRTKIIWNTSGKSFFLGWGKKLIRIESIRFDFKFGQIPLKMYLVMFCFCFNEHLKCSAENIWFQSNSNSTLDLP